MTRKTCICYPMMHYTQNSTLTNHTKKIRRDRLDLEDIGGIRSTSSRYIKAKAQIAFGISQEFYSSSIYRNKVHKMSICPNLFGQILAFFYQTIYQLDMSTTQNSCKSRILSCFYHHIVLNSCIHEINYKNMTPFCQNLHLISTILNIGITLSPHRFIYICSTTDA